MVAFYRCNQLTGHLPPRDDRSAPARPLLPGALPGAPQSSLMAGCPRLGNAGRVGIAPGEGSAGTPNRNPRSRRHSSSPSQWRGRRRMVSSAPVAANPGRARYARITAVGIMQDTDMTHAMAVAELRELSWNEGEIRRATGEFAKVPVEALPAAARGAPMQQTPAARAVPSIPASSSKRTMSGLTCARRATSPTLNGIAVSLCTSGLSLKLC